MIAASRLSSFVGVLSLLFIAWSAVADAGAVCCAAQDQAMTRVREFRATHERPILHEFVRLLRIPNVAEDRSNIGRNARAIMAMMQRRGLAPRLLRSREAPDAPPLVYGEWRVPAARRTLVLYAHYDGQPVNRRQWASDPWNPTLRSRPIEQSGTVIAIDSSAPIDPEARLYARGVADDKGGVMVVLSAIDALRAIHRHPTDSLKVVFEGEEEAGSPHLADILKEHRSLLDAQMWVICDGPVHVTGRNEITYGVRGDINADITVYGANRSLHSGHYGNWAPNPAMRLARLLASMKDESGRVVVAGWYDGIAPLGDRERRAIAGSAEYDDEIRRDLALAAPESSWGLAESTTLPSLNIDGMSSGDVGDRAANVIPATATAALDVRLVVGNAPYEQYRKLVAHVRSQGYYVVDHEPTTEERLAHPLIARMALRQGFYAGYRLPMDDPFAHLIAAAVRAASDREIIELPTSGGSSPMSIIATTLGAGAISVSIANYDDNQHAANENLRLRNLWTGIDLYAALLIHAPTL